MTGYFLIAGGGTGGHIFPAVAIGEALLARVPGAKLLFVGTRYGMERHLIPKLGYALKTLPIRGFLGKSPIRKAALFWRLPASLIVSLALLVRYRPGAVIGVGGYASAPLLAVAALLRFPTMIQEQNAFPGLTNRLLSRLVKLACCGFPEAAARLHCPVIETGNPVRKGFESCRPWRADRSVLLVLGGSQGAVSLNTVLPGVLKRAIQPEYGIRVVHQCGRDHRDRVLAAYRGAAFSVEVLPFIDDVQRFFEESLLVVCRSGASTIAELKLARVPALLVPFPRATGDHQTYNARSLAATGAARLVPESRLAEADAEIGALFQDRERLARMAASYPQQVMNSADLCATIAISLQQRKEVGDIVQEHGTHVPQD